MASLFIINGRSAEQREEEDLAMPDDSEVHDQKRHVERDGMRFRLLFRRMRDHGNMLNQIRLIALALLVWLLLTSDQFAKLVQLVK